MGIEIERKFLVVNQSWRSAATTVRDIRQAYLTKKENVSVRVRIDGAESATLTIKTPTPGIERNEYEYSIPVADAEELLERCGGSIVTKRRHHISSDGLIWEVDEFHGSNANLILAEIELAHVAQPFRRPSWLGREVTHAKRFYNAYLSQHPYAVWGAEAFTNDLTIVP